MIQISRSAWYVTIQLNIITVGYKTDLNRTIELNNDVKTE